MIFRLRRACFFASALALLCAGGTAAQSVDEEIDRRIAMVETASDESMRIDRAAHLAEYVASQKQLDVYDVGPSVVDHMAALLRDEADMVRFYAAASLGFLGRSARRAIPALETALAQREAERNILGQLRAFTAPLSSAQAICAALAKIDLTRVPEACSTYR